MIRLMVQGMTSLALGFALALGAIAAQPRDDAAMRAFFAPPNCSAPCFLGIRPGVTTVQQAIALLQAHPWVTGIGDAGREPPSHPQDYSNIVWNWNGQQPDFLAAGDADDPPYLHINNGIVQYIRLVTRIPYGDAWLTIGAPTRETLIVGGDSAIQSASYLGGKLVFDSKIVCPMKPGVVWNTPISITYSDGSTTAYYSQSVFHLDRAYYHSKCPA